jgi:PelA/Pel-15E family pectate lyase
MKLCTPTSLIVLALAQIVGWGAVVLAQTNNSEGGRSAEAAIEESRFLREKWTRVATGMPDAWYGSEQARAVAENVLNYQTKIGGWAKNSGYHNNSIKQDEWARIQESGIGATFDNDSTLTEMKFLAKVYAKHKDERYRQAFLKAMNYVLESQYPNGGWPQYYPYRKNKSAYSSHITYNDNSMVNVMRFLDDVVQNSPVYTPIQISELIRQSAKQAFERGLQCIIASQILVDGQPTVWCAQHDEFTLKPADARSYELASFSGWESAGIALLLMEIDKPSQEVINSIQGAVAWFEAHKIEGVRVSEITNEEGHEDQVVLVDSRAPPIWARFYDLETGKPFFCDRDGIKKASLAEIGIERRTGYSWYTTAPESVLARYPDWASKHGVAPGKQL